MTDVFVVFGSASDSIAYEPIIAGLKKVGLSVEARVLSAHKTPRELKEALADTNASILVAGAGLSAALPGVLASEQIKPVIGVPCDAAFDGLDSFLSVAQMPPDIPVIATGVGNTASVVNLCAHYLHGFSQIALVKKETGEEKKYFAKCKIFMEEHAFPFVIVPHSKKSDYSKVFIEFTRLGKKPSKTTNTVINVLVTEKSSRKDALKFFDSLQSGYCVALNSYKNAAIAALQLVNMRGAHTAKLLDIRRKASQKVLDANKALK